MKFKPGQEVALLSDTFNFLRFQGVTADPPNISKTYTVIGYAPRTFLGHPVFMLAGFPARMLFFEHTFEALPSIAKVAHDIGGDVSMYNRKKIGDN